MIELVISALIIGFPIKEPIKENLLKNQLAIIVKANEIPKMYWIKRYDKQKDLGSYLQL